MGLSSKGVCFEISIRTRRRLRRSALHTIAAHLSHALSPGRAAPAPAPPTGREVCISMKAK
jgi:hypothetical protein